VQGLEVLTEELPGVDGEVSAGAGGVGAG